ncbi:MAG: RNA-binding protein [Candidatus Electrothrix aestuarii]|jgi:RNA recognition motif-containing protein|uniref:RNA-binding protein n=1 Tax=Candidatus Electrothrix aestuarii TaxID=3062594 RepID=A0AAU8LTE2_9BACT|nr:RNA-binding protein [Candidatus Electrothrix aestuarii]WPD20977.1 MAG: RNA-binding protein [Candidatus Electrothrix sp. GW3-3]
MKLFVGSLPYNITETELIDLFSQYGSVVDINLIKDHFTGTPKGFAFVEMSNRSEGHKAMEDLNGKKYKHRDLVCNESKPTKKKKYHRR